LLIDWPDRLARTIAVKVSPTAARPAAIFTSYSYSYRTFEIFHLEYSFGCEDDDEVVVDNGGRERTELGVELRGRTSSIHRYVWYFEGWILQGVMAGTKGGGSHFMYRSSWGC